MNESLRQMIRTLIGATLLASLLSAHAQTAFPQKTIRIVVPVAGGTMDLLARLVAPKLSAEFKQPVVVDNKPGAGGVIANEWVAKAPADGHTLLVGATGLAINATLNPRLPYDTLNDFVAITNAVVSPQLLVVHKSVPVENVAQLLAYAKQQPAKLSYGSIGAGTQSHLTMEMLKSAANIGLVHIPYKGAAPAVTDLIAGQVQAGFFVASNVVPHIKSGSLKALASTGRRRLATAPDVPTMIEAGFADFEAVAWIGFMARAGTPAWIVDRYHHEIVRILQTSEVRERLVAEGFEVIGSSPKEFRELIVSEIARWGATIGRIDAKGEK